MWTPADIPDQTDRLAVVTGANSGLGYEIARSLAAAGAQVVLACRSEQRGEAAAERIRDAAPAARVAVRRLDLADLASIDGFADGVAREHDRLDLLVNNAGLMAVDEGRTTDGFELQFGVNHLGHFGLTARLLPLLLRTPDSRIATMSSMGHRQGRLRLDDLMFDRRGYRRWQPYFDSKQANLLVPATPQRRSRDADSARGLWQASEDLTGRHARVDA
jgi:protochlorophyllide reductase